MLKRLSYPLAWVEGLTGEATKSTDSTESAPNTGDSNQSVFSKVFSRYVTPSQLPPPPHYCPLCCYAVVSGRNRPLSENWIYNIELVNFYCNLEWMSVGRFFCLFFCTFPMTHIIYLLFATPTTMLHMVLRHATAHHTVRPLLWSRSWVAICFCQRPRQKIQAAVQCPH